MRDGDGRTTEERTTPRAGAGNGEAPAEANDPFGMARFSLHRYSVRHMLIMVSATGLLGGATAMLALQGNWTAGAVTAAGMLLVITATTLMIRVAMKRVAVERWIRLLGMGNFEYTIEPWGRDELSKVCVALETLRQSSIRAMRLDLVQQLSDELQGKNLELENTLEEFRRTQDRIVNQQKLAELGDLSAGIAHEIRTPLQFVQNFATLAEKASRELRESLDREEPEVEYAAELAREVEDSMERIGRNSERANDIVSSMLALSRSTSGGFRQVDLNHLLREHINLAHQAVQAKNPGFRAEIGMDLADLPAEGIPGVPEGLGRVMANLATNACQA